MTGYYTEADLCEHAGCRCEAVVLVTDFLHADFPVELGRFCARHAAEHQPACQSIGCEAAAVTTREHNYRAPMIHLCAACAAHFDRPLPHPTAAWS